MKSRVTVTVLRPGSSHPQAVRFAPAGLPTGTHPAGSANFRTTLRAFRTQPLVSAALLDSQFRAALATVTPDLSGSLRLIGVTRAANFNPSFNLNEERQFYYTDEGPTWSVVLEGSFSSPLDQWTDELLNSLIASAVSRSTSLGPTTIPTRLGIEARNFLAQYPDYRPNWQRSERDIFAALMGDCGNGNNCAQQMWIGGQTTVFPITAINPNRVTVVAPTDVPVTPPAPTVPQPPRPPSPSPPPAAPSGCRAVIASPAWLRPTATFEHIGPLLPVGSTILLLHRTDLQRGPLTLFHAQVIASGNRAAVGQTGYVALDANDIGPRATTPSGCAAGVAGMHVDLTGLATMTPIPAPVVTPPSPPRQTTIVTPRPSTTTTTPMPPAPPRPPTPATPAATTSVVPTPIPDAAPPVAAVRAPAPSGVPTAVYVVGGVALAGLAGVLALVGSKGLKGSR